MMFAFLKVTILPKRQGGSRGSRSGSSGNSRCDSTPGSSRRSENCHHGARGQSRWRWMAPWGWFANCRCSCRTSPGTTPTRCRSCRIVHVHLHFWFLRGAFCLCFRRTTPHFRACRFQSICSLGCSRDVSGNVSTPRGRVGFVFTFRRFRKRLYTTGDGIGMKRDKKTPERRYLILICKGCRAEPEQPLQLLMPFVRALARTPPQS